jgi:hypothetical protein
MLCSFFISFLFSIYPISNTVAPSYVHEIPLPQGYERIGVNTNSFGAYLRSLPLKKDKTVYLYNGQKKYNQSAQYAVINISTGNKDLQQCADAVMRLRAEYLKSANPYVLPITQEKNIAGVITPIVAGRDTWK